MGFKKGLKKVGKIVAKPVTWPVELAQKGAEVATMKIIMGILRHALTTGGGALVADGTLTGDDLTQAVGAIMTIVGIVASVVAKKRTS